MEIHIGEGWKVKEDLSSAAAFMGLAKLAIETSVMSSSVKPYIEEGRSNSPYSMGIL